MISFIIQGKNHPNTYKMVEQLKGKGEIIVSCYENEFPPVNCKVIKSSNSPPVSKIQNSLPYQIRTTLAGLQQATNELSIKLRSDEYYNLDPIIKAVKDNPLKYTTNNIFFIPGLKETPHTVFHTSDHIIGGKTDMLLRQFTWADMLLNQVFKEEIDVPAYGFGLNYTKSISIEGFLCLCWFHSNEIDYNNGKYSIEEANKIVKKHCCCVDIDTMTPYEWKAGGNTYTDSAYLYNNGYNKSIRSIEEL
jgi:hypothetical protein